MRLSKMNPRNASFGADQLEGLLWLFPLYLVVERHEHRSHYREPMFSPEFVMFDEHVDLFAKGDESESGQGTILFNS